LSEAVESFVPVWPLSSEKKVAMSDVIAIDAGAADDGPVDNASDQVFNDDDDAASSTAAWELSKENVLPLRTGRQLKRLNEAVARDSLTCDSALREERHAFEAELRACSLSSDDNYDSSKPSSSSTSHRHRLLDIWHRYVLWTEQNFPSGKELGEILQRSLQAFPESSGEMAAVADETDYVDLWLKLIDTREEPGDLFQYMYSKKIGRLVGLFYEQWAWHLEDMGNTKKASAVLAKGISNEASSVARLEKLRTDLEVRVARGLSEADGRRENEENEEGEPSRKTLGDLRGKGKHMAAPNVRVGPQATISGPRRGVSGSDVNASNGASRSSASSSGRRPMTTSTSSNAPPSTSSSSSGFQIFSDDNDYRDVVTDNKFASNPVEASVRTKENAQKAQAWSKVRSKQKVSSIPTTPLTPKFDIHVDQSDEDVGAPEVGALEDGCFKTPAKTPAKTINMTHARPLSTKKVGKDPAKPLDFLERVDEGKTEEKFMFCKDKVYQGLEEFSLEEIRFELWKKKRVPKERA